MIKVYLKNMIFALLALGPMICFAEVPNWEIVPSESSITFTATQNGAPVTGKFKTFRGEIKGDPTQLNTCTVKLVVDIGSITDAYNQLQDTLKKPEWFDLKLYPQAIFQSKEFIKTGDKTYQAKGTLTIRNKTVPITLLFTQEKYTPTKGTIKGSTTVKRSDFNVGTGEWADTKTVKDEVRVDFVITAVRK